MEVSEALYGAFQVIPRADRSHSGRRAGENQIARLEFILVRQV
jgi:hypothetical protein